MAGKKRKAEAARLEETDRALYGAFRGAANSLSQLYTLAMGAQKASFHAGERHAMLFYSEWKRLWASPLCTLQHARVRLGGLVRFREKLYEWILRQHENGLRLTVADIASHIQHEIQYGGDNASASPRSQYPSQITAPTVHIPNTSNQQPSPSSFMPGNPGLAQSKNSMVFSNALSSPIRRSLQPYHLEQGGDAGYFANGASRDANPTASNDSSMDMHSDSPAHDSY
ncbi:uncharacterized protein C2845_PM03G32590 [Panicum miliaceum]|uniref:Uncharacterized protein n=1 Tax=Panicum miliaceum TaxID=4540 RepID=A0A3L6T9J4_PANMI|nr:uncharacterized protein C2845_PM03G32590 [Panicum miliaceum]